MGNIPRTIHYCWFGKSKMSFEMEAYIEGWKKILRGYEFVLWNESSFDVTGNDFAIEAYESKKWAFVSDYVRLKVLYEYGGIYLDTDIEVLKRFDELLDDDCFMGFESKYVLGTALMASTSGNKWIERLLESYENKHFITADGSFDLKPSTSYITDIAREECGLLFNNKIQQLDGFTVYPKDFFYPKNMYTGRIKRTNNSFCIHHWNGSWCESENNVKTAIKTFLYMFGDNVGDEVRHIYQLSKQGLKH